MFIQDHKEGVNDIVKKATIIMLFSLLSISTANGQMEINQLCSGSGCFFGDDPGFPIRINEPGSYILTSNIESNFRDQPTNVFTLIEIQSDEVTLDLNGFSIIGELECAGSPPECGSGIRINSGIKSSGQNIHIKNGAIKGFDGRIIPIGCVSHSGKNFTIENIRVSDCEGWGISVNAESGHIKNTVITDAGGGIQAADLGGRNFSDSINVSNNSIRNVGDYGVSGGICYQNILSLTNLSDPADPFKLFCRIQLGVNSCDGEICE